jgi:hypothetical protein
MGGVGYQCDGEEVVCVGAAVEDPKLENDHFLKLVIRYIFSQFGYLCQKIWQP